MSLQSVMRRGAKRAVYDALSGREPIDFFEYTANLGKTKPSSRGKTKADRTPYDREGSIYIGQPYCLFGKNNIKLKVMSVNGRMINTDDGKRHRISSVKFCY